MFQVCPQSKILGDDATRNMIKVTAVKPNERFEKIKANLQEKNKAFKNDPHALAFGISVSDKCHEVNGRVLDSPSPAYVKDNKAKGMYQLMINSVLIFFFQIFELKSKTKMKKKTIK